MSILDSSSSSSSSSTKQSLKKYDVFINFHSKDTRNNFTSHLHTALSKEVITFFDDNELKKGDKISPALIKAIEESYASIVVFSEDYASSKWCLNELVKILECKKDQGQIVLPIFYKVKPTEVRYRIGNFGLGFGKLEQRMKYNKVELHKLQDTLNEVAELAGWHDQNQMSESNLIKDVVKEVLEKVNNILVEVEKTYANANAKAKQSVEKTMYAIAKQSVEKAMLSISLSSSQPYIKFNGKIDIQQPEISGGLPRSCEAKDSSSDENELQEKRSKLGKGSPITIIKAPKFIKTAASPVPLPNFTSVKRGNVGRIVSRESNDNDVWAVRFSNGIYIIEGKYFKPFDLA